MSQLGTGNTASFVERREEGRGRRERCSHGTPLLRLAPQTGVRQKADLPEHAERCGRKMKSLGVKYNSSAMVEYKSWGGKKKKGGCGGVKSHHCCYGNQILPITRSRRAKILGSLAAAHIASQTPPTSCSPSLLKP